MAELTLDGDDWIECPDEERAAFLPAAIGGWATYPTLHELFTYNGPGIMSGRTWVIAPDGWSLQERWNRLIAERDPDRKEMLFFPQLREGKLAGRHINRIVHEHLGRHRTPPMSVAASKCGPVSPIQYGFRSFDRQWIIPDARVINDYRPELWSAASEMQVYLTAPHDRAPSGGPAVTFCSVVPDLHHYNGRGGRAFPLWADSSAVTPNIPAAVMAALSSALRTPVSAPDLLAYIAAVAAHPAYATRFATDLVQPGLRIPLTTDAALFAEAARLGRRIIWLHTFGERFVDASESRPAGAPRLPALERPTIPEDGAIPTEAEAMPDTIRYDAATRRLHVGQGHVDNVSPAVWAYEVSGKQVLTQWFSYRGRDRSRPIIGDRRKPSPLGDIQPPGWLPEYTAELLNVLNVLGGLVALETAQADLLERICNGPTLPASALHAAVAADTTKAPAARRGRRRVAAQGDLLGGSDP